MTRSTFNGVLYVYVCITTAKHHYHFSLSCLIKLYFRVKHSSDSHTYTSNQ